MIGRLNESYLEVKRNEVVLKAIIDKEAEVTPITQEVRMLSHFYGFDSGLVLCSDRIREWCCVYLAPLHPQSGLV